MTDAAARDVSILWNWMRMGMEPEPADAIVGFGCYDEQIPLRAAELWKQDLAPIIVFSGGLGRNTKDIFRTSEAMRFSEIARAAGVPEKAMLLEKRSTNTAENLRFTLELLKANSLRCERVLAVHKPYMERRLFAAAALQWKGIHISVTSPQVSVAEHLHAAEAVGMTERGVIDTLVGDVQRMEIYARRGFQLPQPLPTEVRAACIRLINAGYDGQLIPGEDMSVD